MKFNKGIKIFLLAILLVFGFFGVYKIWPTRPLVVETKPESIDPMVYEPNEQVEIIPTADPKWNLYRNFKYGFQIQYPADWRFIRIYKNNDGILIGFSPTSIDSYIVLNIYLNKNLDTLINESKNNERFVSTEELKSQGKILEKISTRNPYLDYNSYLYAFSMKNKTFSLGSDGSPANSWYIDKMVSTLEIF